MQSVAIQLLIYCAIAYSRITKQIHDSNFYGNNSVSERRWYICGFVHKRDSMEGQESGNECEVDVGKPNECDSSATMDNDRGA